MTPMRFLRSTAWAKRPMSANVELAPVPEAALCNQSRGQPSLVQLPRVLVA
jgi:hypothetical protein